MYKQPDWAPLSDAVRLGDNEQVMTELRTVLGPKLTTFFMARGQSEPQPLEEMVLMRVHKSLTTASPDEVFTIIERLPTIAASTAESLLDDALDDARQVNAMVVILKELPASERAAAIAYYVDGVSAEQVCAEYNISPDRLSEIRQTMLAKFRAATSSKPRTQRTAV